MGLETQTTCWAEGKGTRISSVEYLVENGVAPIVLSHADLPQQNSLEGVNIMCVACGKSWMKTTHTGVCKRCQEKVDQAVLDPKNFRPDLVTEYAKDFFTLNDSVYAWNADV